MEGPVAGTSLLARWQPHLTLPLTLPHLTRRAGRAGRAGAACSPEARRRRDGSCSPRGLRSWHRPGGV